MQKKYAIVPVVLEKQSKGGVLDLVILKQGMSQPGRPVYLRCEAVKAGLKCLRLVASDQLQVSCTGEEMKALFRGGYR